MSELEGTSAFPDKPIRANTTGEGVRESDINRRFDLSTEAIWMIAEGWRDAGYGSRAAEMEALCDDRDKLKAKIDKLESDPKHLKRGTAQALANSKARESLLRDENEKLKAVVEAVKNIPRYRIAISIDADPNGRWVDWEELNPLLKSLEVE